MNWLWCSSVLLTLVSSGRSLDKCSEGSIICSTYKEYISVYQNGPSVLSVNQGHWPSQYCTITDTYLHTNEQVFHIGMKNLHTLNKCFGLQSIWRFLPKNETNLNTFTCDQVFDHGFIFTMYYYNGSNYYHIHYDTVIPLYNALYNSSLKLNAKKTALLPGVEVRRGEKLDMETPAFLDEEAYWIQVLRVVAGPFQLLPLDSRLGSMQKTICFKKIHFGTPKVNYNDAKIIRGFISFVKEQLGIDNRSVQSQRPLVGIIHRSGRRKILNEEELVQAVLPMADAELVDFSGLGYQEQVAQVQNYAVLVGVNGAGLMNALYLPESSVAVQLVPYKVNLNYVEFGELLKLRGPYLEWHNTHPELNHPSLDDKYNSRPDTIVHVDEFKMLMRKALDLYRDKQA